ncbi:MAG TPA: ABC transporter permease [Candidatus Limnocylindrales bacterium]|nr:ABC transporter permease [Candidatus Limnocylindrales bacterium]
MAAIARRVMQQVRRDRRSLALLIIAPLAVLALLGFVIRDEKPIETRLGIVALGGPADTRVPQALSAAAAQAGITVVDVGTDAASGRAAVQDGRADVVIVAPAPFAGGSAAIQVITLGEAPADDGARLQVVAGLIERAVSQGAPLTIEHETIYGSPAGDVLNTFAPALIGFFGFFFVFVLTGISFLRERTGGTLERLLATPVRRSEIVVGYSLGFGFFATIQVVLILIFTLGVLTVPGIGPLASFNVGLGITSAGSPALAFVVLFLTAIGAVNLAIFLSTYARTELQVLEFIPIVIVPQALLGGVFWSVNSLPDPLGPIAGVLPMTHAIDGLRAVLVRGAGLSDGSLQLDIAYLVGIAILFVVLAGTTIRREIA